MQPIVRAFALALLLAPCALARADSYDLGSFRLALIDDPVRVEFQKGGAVPTLDNLQQVIRIAAATRGWKVATQADGRMELINVVRDHTMSVELVYDETGYRLRYLQSTNLLYAAKGGMRVIHKNYNEWLNELVLAINGGLQVPAQTSKGFAPVAKIDAVPYVSEKGRGAYQEFLGMPTPRAFAIAPNGSWGRAVRLRPGARGDVAEDALERCNRRGEGQCRVYAIDGHVVWAAASDR